MRKIIIENFFSSNMKEKETWLSFIELEFLFSWNTWNIPRRNLATNLQNSRNNSLLFCFSSPIYQFLRIEGAPTHVLSPPSSNPLVEHLACCDSFIFHSSLLSVAKKTGMKKDGERSRVAAEHIVHVASGVSNNFSPLDRSTKSLFPLPLSPYLSSIWFVPGLVETSFTVQDSEMHSPSWPISFLPSLEDLSL